jgi:hypothetical protein
MSATSKVLGVVGCEVFEDEMAYAIGGDHDVRHVIVLDETVDKEMAKKLECLAPDKEIRCISPEDLAKLEPYCAETVILWVEPIGLHQSPPMLREEVVADLKKLEPHIQSGLIFYGVCGTAFRNLEKIQAAFSIPITILKEENNVQADDCTGTLLGGAEAYREFLIKEKGAYTMNTMWAAHWPEFMVETQMLSDPNNLDEVRAIFSYMDYQKVTKMHTGYGDPEFERRWAEFCDTFGLGKHIRQCTLRIVESSYQLAKSRLPQ